MNRLTHIVPLLTLAAAGAFGMTGCGEGSIPAASAEELLDAQKLRAASLKGEGDGGAPRLSPSARKSAAKRRQAQARPSNSPSPTTTSLR
ncbi:hypothetical protein [Singulisphaera sp. PoT]|uniref:hypothetical protein n=1 Tax=Singulisphaera sp. PoT TaxID=3411797 RepID=UPI003BF570B8